MLPFLLVLACGSISSQPVSSQPVSSQPVSSQPGPTQPVLPSAELDESWVGVPLTRGQWPAWATGAQSKTEAVSTQGDGRRVAYRIAGPLPRAKGGDSSQAVVLDTWRTKLVPAEGPVRTWEIDLFAEPLRVAGTPLHLAPSGADVVASTSEVEVSGVLDLGHQAFGFRCLGVGADMEPDGWCLAFISQVWVETWVETR